MSFCSFFGGEKYRDHFEKGKFIVRQHVRADSSQTNSYSGYDQNIKFPTSRQKGQQSLLAWWGWGTFFFPRAARDWNKLPLRSTLVRIRIVTGDTLK